MTVATGASTPNQYHLVAVGDTLPRASFRRLAAPGTVSWSQGPMASVVFLPHGGSCTECDGYIGRLGEAVDSLKEWATRPIVLVDPAAPAAPAAPQGPAAPAAPAAPQGPNAPAAHPGPNENRSGIITLVDDGTGRAQLGVAEDRAAVVQADRWGAIFDVATVGTEAGHDAGLPTAAELVALAKFIDIQCPECGIPSKEWLGASPFPLG